MKRSMDIYNELIILEDEMDRTSNQIKELSIQEDEVFDFTTRFKDMLDSIKEGFQGEEADKFFYEAESELNSMKKECLTRIDEEQQAQEENKKQLDIHHKELEDERKYLLQEEEEKRDDF